MPVSSPSSSPLPRLPTFMSRAGGPAAGAAAQPSFGGSAKAPGPPRVVPFFERAEGEPEAPAPAEVPAMEPPPEIESLAPPLPPPFPQPTREMSERLARAVADLAET